MTGGKPAQEAAHRSPRSGPPGYSDRSEVQVTATDSDGARDEHRDAERTASRGCATVGVSLLLTLGVLLSVPITEAVLEMGVDRPGETMGDLAGVFVAPFAFITGIALVIAASPRGAALRPVRWAAGLVGAVLIAASVVVFVT